MPVPPVDEHVTVSVLLTPIDVADTVEVFVRTALFTVSLRSLFTTLPLPSLTFTRIVYVVTVPGLKVTFVVVE